MRGKQKYFRLPWSRMRRSARGLYRQVMSELQEADEALHDRRIKRQQVKLVLRAVYELSA